ncbi:hypothetical protein TRIATDRAFT_300246 [Trichoderma atroviride IMI 206040]|uniref:Uncharacterized protein n=1 Tax=Hypocrea atroviridis (strain ATCC 20476 / IMI 206040) TaxID=452589 RepID=G9NZC7_HYPAI|nr:uncharacterized protein TRIATDRAFT_300246 [Trichoderma atroviride IMI 206040]EHK43836.1 hypothetical protein TRIATDRAFT_300246 [Trichoderma atroviride IMI 206040]
MKLMIYYNQQRHASGKGRRSIILVLANSLLGVHYFLQRQRRILAAALGLLSALQFGRRIPLDNKLFSAGRPCKAASGDGSAIFGDVASQIANRAKRDAEDEIERVF